MVEMATCAICKEDLAPPEKLVSPRGLAWVNGRIARIAEKILYYACFSCGQTVMHQTCAENWLKVDPKCPCCNAPSHAPVWHRQLYHVSLVAAGLVGFVVMSHVTAAAVGLPQRVVWARERLYFGLSRQFYAAWTSLLVGFPLGAACVQRLGQEWDFRTRQPTEAPKHQHPPPVVRPRWRHEWNLVAGSWVALWTGVITMQILFGKIAASQNGIPIRNLWVLSQRSRLPELLRHRMEMAVTLGNVLGAGGGLVGFTFLWDGVQSTAGDTSQKRAERFWEVATTMAGLLVASHLFTLFIKEWACTPRRQVWHGFGIAKLFKGDPTLHSRKLALATAALAAPFVLVPAYVAWVGRD